MREGYDVAQICRNGHVISEFYRSQPEFSTKFCKKCGQPTITACERCNTPIQGHYHAEGVIGFFNYAAPSFCHECGTPYPWTSARLEAARELADTFEQLSESERATLKADLDDLVRESPRTPVAESRFKRLVGRAGREAFEGLRAILVDIVSESVRKSIFGGG